MTTPPTGLHPLLPHTTSVPLGYVAQSQDAKRKERPTALSKGVKGGPVGLAVSCQQTRADGMSDRERETRKLPSKMIAPHNSFKVSNDTLDRFNFFLLLLHVN